MTWDIQQTNAKKSKNGWIKIWKKKGVKVGLVEMQILNLKTSTTIHHSHELSCPALVI